MVLNGKQHTCNIPGRHVDCPYDCLYCPLSYVIADDAGDDQRHREEAEGSRILGDKTQ